VARPFATLNAEEVNDMQTFADLNSPRHQLPFERLPRGFVPFPEHIVHGVAELAAKYGYGEEYARDSIVRHTLIWFYEGLPVAYRELPAGLEVLALGFEEVAEYRRNRQPSVKIAQP
jgi:hypothetical protein